MSDMMNAECKENADVIKQLIEGFRYFKDYEVLVGIPAENSGHPGGVTNVELMHIHTNGSPANHIPPRPTIEPALADSDTRKVIQEQLVQGISAALSGDVDTAKGFQDRAGIAAENAVRARFGSGDLAPNAPRTIARKGSSRPLIDTGSLRTSITHVIRKK